MMGVWWWWRGGGPSLEYNMIYLIYKKEDYVLYSKRTTKVKRFAVLLVDIIGGNRGETFSGTLKSCWKKHCMLRNYHIYD